MKDLDRQVFDTAYALWSARGKIYETRRRLKRYTYGNQWGDTVFNDLGESMIESDLIVKKGRRPITNNLIRRLVKTIVGRYRDMSSQNGWYDTAPDDYESTELLEEIDSRLLEEFLISGMAIQRIADDNPFFKGRTLVTNVNPEAFFCNDFSDPRCYDLDIAGMLHDMSPAEVLLRFGNGTKTRKEKLLRLLAADANAEYGGVSGSYGFFEGAPGRHRIIEVWSREYSDNGVVKWRVRWFTANGVLISTYDSPWKHALHPFAVKFYPLTDGEIHSFVEDVVDQQRYINRLIVLIDSILKTSAKCVLLFPMKQLDNGNTIDDVAEKWAKPGGVIPISGNTSLMPQQLSATGGDAGAYRLLEMELKLFDQTAGVGAALLGGSAMAPAGTGAEYYKAQVENATIALADIFRTFRSLISYRNNLIL